MVGTRDLADIAEYLLRQLSELHAYVVLLAVSSPFLTKTQQVLGRFGSTMHRLPHTIIAFTRSRTPSTQG